MYIRRHPAAWLAGLTCVLAWSLPAWTRPPAELGVVFKAGMQPSAGTLSVIDAQNQRVRSDWPFREHDSIEFYVQNLNLNAWSVTATGETTVSGDAAAAAGAWDAVSKLVSGTAKPLVPLGASPNATRSYLLAYATAKDALEVTANAIARIGMLGTTVYSRRDLQAKAATVHADTSKSLHAVWPKDFGVYGDPRSGLAGCVAALTVKLTSPPTAAQLEADSASTDEKDLVRSIATQVEQLSKAAPAAQDLFETTQRTDFADALVAVGSDNVGDGDSYSVVFKLAPVVPSAERKEFTRTRTWRIAGGVGISHSGGFVFSNLVDQRFPTTPVTPATAPPTVTIGNGVKDQSVDFRGAYLTHFYARQPKWDHWALSVGISPGENLNRVRFLFGASFLSQTKPVAFFASSGLAVGQVSRLAPDNQVGASITGSPHMRDVWDLGWYTAFGLSF